jgi:hypothetical protein
MHHVKKNVDLKLTMLDALINWTQQTWHNKQIKLLTFLVMIKNNVSQKFHSVALIHLMENVPHAAQDFLWMVNLLKFIGVGNTCCPSANA